MFFLENDDLPLPTAPEKVACVDVVDGTFIILRDDDKFGYTCPKNFAAEIDRLHPEYKIVAFNSHTWAPEVPTTSRSHWIDFGFQFLAQKRFALNRKSVSLREPGASIEFVRDLFKQVVKENLIRWESRSGKKMRHFSPNFWEPASKVRVRNAADWLDSPSEVAWK